MPAPSHEQLARNARFVFHGTVQSASPRDVPEAPGTRAMTIRVDEIVQGPDKLNTYQGRDVFVVPRKGERLAKGERGIFYTNGLSFGETLVLQSVGHLPLRMGAAMARSAAHPAAMLKKRDVRERLESADMVVVGTVSAVRMPASEATPRSGVRGVATGGAASRGPISEHDPQWRDAVIEVERVEKGRGVARQVVVRFPASDDVRWFRAPKFTPGEQGVFILHRSGSEAPTAARGAARAVAAGADGVFTALHPEDVQPPELQEEIETIVKSVPGTARMPAKRPRPAAARKTTRGAVASKRRRSSR